MNNSNQIFKSKHIHVSSVQKGRKNNSNKNLRFINLCFKLRGRLILPHTTMAHQSNLFTAEVSETEGTGCPDWLYASGKGVAMSTSPKEALALAKQRARDAITAKWVMMGNPYGGCQVLYEVALYKGGKLISQRF